MNFANLDLTQLIPKLTHTNSQQHHRKTEFCTFVSFCHKNGFELHGYVAIIQELPLLSLTILYQNVNLNRRVGAK
ncbi:MAG: hypothetical protein ACK468_10580 [Dolichospermum sp.]